MNILFKVACLALAMGLVYAKLSPSHMPQSRATDLSLMRFMMDNQANSRSNPQRSLQCFNYYIPLLNNITSQYEIAYKECLNQAENMKEVIDNQTAALLVPIRDASSNACENLLFCNTVNSSLPALECYTDVGSSNTKLMYEVSANASVIAVDIREQYRVVETNQYRCTNSTEREYVENTAKTYEQLQSCIAGITTVPQRKRWH